VFAVVVSLLGYPAPGLSADAGQVLAVKKDVYLIREGNRESAKPQSPLYLKDAVQTAQASRTKLFFRDDSVLNLGPLSQVVVDEYLQAAAGERSQSVYRLVEGSLKVVVGKSKLEIHTPTAVAAARGTKFIVWVEGSGENAATGLLVLEGEVLLRNVRAAVKGIQKVQMGEMSRVPSSRPPTTPVPADQKVLQQYNSETRAIGSVFEKDREDLPEPSGQGALLTAEAIREEVNLLRSPPIAQEPLGVATTGHNAVVRIQFPQ